jgi:hypothetical protein
MNIDSKAKVLRGLSSTASATIITFVQCRRPPVGAHLSYFEYHRIHIVQVMVQEFLEDTDGLAYWSYVLAFKGEILDHVSRI